MPCIYKLEGYPLSRDYERLAHLATISSIACVVDYDGDLRDIAHTLYNDETSDGRGLWQVSARGIGYLHAYSKEDFIKRCEHLHLEYFDLPRTL